MRYVVDTNVVSELAKRSPNEAVVLWFSAHAHDAYLTAITIEEMRFGCLMLPEGRRREALSRTIDVIIESYASKTLSFDGSAAKECARLHYQAIKSGRTPSIEDLMIAAIARSNHAAVVTRNVRDFSFLGIDVVDPFAAV